MDAASPGANLLTGRMRFETYWQTQTASLLI
jgi:hypothetical protein